MPHPAPKIKTTREAVLAELTQMAEGRHPGCETLIARFLRDPQYQQAAKILSDAIQVESYRRLTVRDEIPAPPAWLLPI